MSRRGEHANLCSLFVCVQVVVDFAAVVVIMPVVDSHSHFFLLIDFNRQKNSTMKNRAFLLPFEAQIFA